MTARVIFVACPQCGGTHRALKADLGRRVRCPRCKITSPLRADDIVSGGSEGDDRPGRVDLQREVDRPGNLQAPQAGTVDYDPSGGAIGVNPFAVRREEAELLAVKDENPAVDASEPSAPLETVAQPPTTSGYEATIGAVDDAPSDTATVGADPARYDPDQTVMDGALPSASPPEILRIGRFEVREVLGEGAFGRVYRAYDPILDRQVALKVPTFPADQPQLVERFLREAKSAARLKHPNIVAVFETGKEGNDYYIASEFVEGWPLSDRVRDKPPTVRRAVQWVRDLALALAYAHGEGIIHRDIKPANIMISRQDRPQLMDFGLAKRADEAGPVVVGEAPASTAASEATVDGTVLGTPAYMSPEQARGDLKSVGPASDQYSLGVVLYELLTGRRPFDGPPHVVLGQVRNVAPPAPRELNSKIPRRLDRICRQAMAKDPADRFADMGRFATDLQLWLKADAAEGALDYVESGPAGQFARIIHWGRQNAGPLTAAGILLLISSLTAGYFVDRAVINQRLAQAEHDASEQQRAANARFVESEGRLTEMRQQERRVRTDLLIERGHRRCEQGDTTTGAFLLAKAYVRLDAQQVPAELIDALSRHTGRLHALRAICSLQYSYPGAYLRDAPVHELAFSPSGDRLLVRTRDRVAMFDPETGHGIKFAFVRHEMDYNGDFRPSVGQGRELQVETGESSLIAVRLAPLAGHKDFAPEELVAQLTTGANGDRMRFAANGRRFLMVQDQQVAVYDVETGAAAYPPLRSDSAVMTGDFDPTGQVIVTGHIDGVVRRWSSATGQPLGEPLPGEGTIYRVAADRQATRILAIRDNATGFLWNTASGRRLDLAVNSAGSSGSNAPLVFSPDGEMVAIDTGGGVVRLWSTAEGREFGKPIENGSATSLARLAFSPDGRLLVVSASDSLYRIFHVADGRPFLPAKQHAAWASCVAFRGDGRYVATASATDGASIAQVQVWDAVTGRPVGQPLVHAHRVTQAAFHPDGQRLATGDLEGVRIWDLAYERPTAAEIESPSSYGALPLFGHDDAVFALMDSGSVRFWNLATGAPLGAAIGHALLDANAQQANNDFVRQFPGPMLMAVTRDLRKYATLWGGGKGDASSPVTLEVRTTEGDRPCAPPLTVAAAASGVRFSPDGSLLLVTSRDAIHRYRAETLEQLEPTIAFGGSSVFSPDGETIAVWSDQIARLFSASSGMETGPAITLDEPIRAAQFGRNGQLIAVMGERAARVTNRATGDQFVINDGQRLASVAFSAQGDRLLTVHRSLDPTVTGWQFSARMWNPNSGGPLGDPLLFGNNASVLLAADNARTLLVRDDNGLQLWDALTGKPVGGPLAGQSYDLPGAFSPGGERLLTWSGTQCFIWEAATGDQLGLPQSHSGSIQVGMFNSDGTTFAIVGDSRARILPTPDFPSGFKNGIFAWLETTLGATLNSEENGLVCLSAGEWSRRRERPKGDVEGPVSSTSADTGSSP
jgi:eukaryotic-like serine/threonine-protein kinase